MYFEIENTPEHIRRARKSEKVKKEKPVEECPRLLLAPFSKPPQVVFDNVLIGTTCERQLEVFNPLKQSQHITLGKLLPPGLIICLPGEMLEIEPETCYTLTMMWTPSQPTAMRETLRFTNGTRARYDVIVVLKSAMEIKGKENRVKGLKVTPGKKKKKLVTKKSPVAIYKKKIAVINKNYEYNETIDMHTHENVQITQRTYVKEKSNKCPFDSPSSLDMNFNTSEIFSNVRSTNILQDTYDKSVLSNHFEEPKNVLKPSNYQTYDTTATDLFDKLTFTPLKSGPLNYDKLDKGPKIIVSLNSDSELDDSLDKKSSNKENETHSILTLTQSQSKWMAVNHIEHFNETTVQNKHPNTSSPKEINSPNFTINTEFSRISDLSFFPQRFSTERKCFTKINETQELIDENKVGTDKFSHGSSVDGFHLNSEGLHYFNREAKLCRQSLFREYQMKEASERHMMDEHECSSRWYSELRADRSPPRSVTPPLQAIPEESIQLSDTRILDKTDNHMTTFTINRTFDKVNERNLSTSTRQTWSKKAVRAEPDLWKMPVAQPRKSLKPKTKKSIGMNIANTTFDSNKSMQQNVTMNQISNVYSQSLTVDPFLSTTYFYDEEAVYKFEKEFKRWLNCILTPPADLDSNVEQKIDVGKAWIENRNKEVPLAPTREQVSNVYHNSHRLESLRRQARALLMSPEIALVFQKLSAQIEKKLIMIRNDRNLHLDTGLQKIIMELLLCYNPLWLRIGLEAIYGIVLPLKSNNDISGLTTFIIQRLFKNPFLKNKHSKSSAPNMLLPAYIEAIKKFTLKKFFILVYFLDQAKQRKLISHDPCLFCRNAICKESREIIIRFTRELIAGIGDITKHLRPIGYVVSHKQSYLDEYKYAVHNLALDIRDGVRLTKVMEIILMKNGLLNQLRTPPISRLQKIHNVQVALNALKEANFVIVGDITAIDIADGHREKTLSLLWQLIHVFRAPLFEKAATIIQTWWKKKYEVIVEKKREEEKARQRLNYVASVIQNWWRTIQYKRRVEEETRQRTIATVVLQKYCRMWLCRTRLRKFKMSVLIIEEWYKSVKLMREAKTTLCRLKYEHEMLRQYSATVIQSRFRQWSCRKSYIRTKQSIIKIQSYVRMILARKQYLKIKQSVILIQEKYRGKMLMKTLMFQFAELKRSAITIQSYYRMVKQRKIFLEHKKSVKILEDRFIALKQMRDERKQYLKLRETAIKLQAVCRRNKCRKEYVKDRDSLIRLQRRIRANQLMRKERKFFLQIKNSAIVLQKYIKSYLLMKKIRMSYLKQRKSATCIQVYYRSYILGKAQRKSYLELKRAAITLQRRYRGLILMRREKNRFINHRNAAIVIQRQFRAQLQMKQCKENYNKLRNAVITVQRQYRAMKQMCEEKQKYTNFKSACIKIQRTYRAYLLGKKQRNEYLKLKKAAQIIQSWYRSTKKTIEIKKNYEQIKHACIVIQTRFIAYTMAKKQRHEFIRIKTAVTTIQKYYRSYIITRTIRREYIQIRKSTITIQRYYKCHLETKKQREEYLKMKSAIVLIQAKYRALVSMKKERENYIKLRNATISIQNRYRSLCLMRQLKHKYQTIIKSCITIQKYYRAYKLGSKQRQEFLKLRKSVVTIQNRYRAMLAMRRERHSYLNLIKAVVCIQERYRANKLMLTETHRYLTTLNACKAIQNYYRALTAGRKQRESYLKLRSAVILIQTRYRELMKTRKIRQEYLLLKKTTILVQRRFRTNKARKAKENNAAKAIQTWYKSVKLRDACRKEYFEIRKRVILIQTEVRTYIYRKRFVQIRIATTTIQTYYRSYKLAKRQRQEYLNTRRLIITLQSYVRSYIARKRFLKLRSSVLLVQALFRFKRQQKLMKKRRNDAAVCLQKNIRKYLAQKWYKTYISKLVYVQQKWRGKLVTRLVRCDFLQKRRLVTSIQAVARGYLVRKQMEWKKKEIQKRREEQRRHWAASKIQALFRGIRVRVHISHDDHVTELRRRWRAGGLASTQETLRARNEHAMDVLMNMQSIEAVIMAFRSLELLTEVFPMMYNDNASLVVNSVYIYMSATNRSISSIEVLKLASAVLVNLTRYRVTGPNIYERERISPILKFMWRFSNSETQLFCILCTYLWLFSKYDTVKQDLKEYLHLQENHKMLMTIKGNVDRMKRMATNSKNKCLTSQTKFASHTSHLADTLPILEPDYGIVRVDKPRYFKDAQQAINCLFHTYKL